MKQNFPFDFEIDEEIFDDFGEIDELDKSESKSSACDVHPIHAEWDIVNAFNVINEHAP